MPENERYNLEQAQEEAEKLRQKVDSDEASNYKNAEKLTDEESIAAIIKYFKQGDPNEAIRLKNECGQSDQIIQSQEIRNAAKEEMIRNLRRGYIDLVNRIKDSFNLLEDVIQLPEAQAAAQEGMLYQFKEGGVGMAIRINDVFSLSNEILQPIAKEGMIYNLTVNSVSNAIKIKDAFNLPVELVQDAAVGVMVNKLKGGDDYNQIIKIKDAFGLTEEVIQHPDVQAVAKQAMMNKLRLSNFEYVIKIKDVFNLPEELVHDAAEVNISQSVAQGYNYGVENLKNQLNLPMKLVQGAVKEGLAHRLTERNLNELIPEIISTKDKFDLPEELVQDMAKDGMIFWLPFGRDEAFKIKNTFNPPGEILQSPEVQVAAKRGITHLTGLGYFDDAVKLKEEFNVSEVSLQAAVKEVMIRRIKSGNFYQVFELKHKFNLPAETLQSSEIQAAAKEMMINRLKKADIDSALEIKEKFNMPEEIAQAAAKEMMIDDLTEANFDFALEIKDKFRIPEEVMQFPEVHDAIRDGIIYVIQKGHVDSALEIKDKFKIIFDKKDEEVVKTAVIFSTYAGDFSELADITPDQYTDEQLREMWIRARELPTWQDEQTVAGPFEAGAETFGYKQMLEYIKRDGLSLHDALHAFRAVLELFQASGLSESEFYGQVLQQVQKDDQEYAEGTAHHHLNTIAQSANKNVAEVMARVQEYKDIEQLQKLAAVFNTPQAVFSSWTNLKRYSELEQLLSQTEILDELKELKAEGNEALYKYIETLAFHPDSKVKMAAVMEFWRDPEAFLSADASHTPQEIQDRKKPSNYVNMPNLDLTAPELRDALVEGKMDGLSTFKPLEVRYVIADEDVAQEPLQAVVQKALGSRKEGIKGVAKDPKKLFSELGKLLKLHKVSVIDYLQGKQLPEGVDLSQPIESLVYNRDYGMRKPLVKTKEYVARINQKSDPEGAIAGDDTVNCMPFGDGKNTVYTFNPNTAQFVIRIVKENGKERTIAQSVLTKDMDIKTSVPKVIEKLQQKGEHLEDVLPADILTTAPVYAACDNVEVAPNYSDERHQKIIEAIFRNFFKEYMSRYAAKDGLDASKMPIGQGYTDALNDLPTEANTFAPQAPVSYSDKTGGKVYMLDLKNETDDDLIKEKTIKEPRTQKPEETPAPDIKGLGYLTFEDTLKVSYLEGKAYSDNESLMQFMFNMENGLIAKDINNSAKDRPNMSLKYTDDGGRMRGYMLAWEGKLTDENVKYEPKSEEFFDQPCIYISDIATDKNVKTLDRAGATAAINLVRGFTDLYKRNYLDNGNMMPIYAQAREATSYKIVKKQLDKLGRAAGFKFELIELPTYEVEEDVMHPIIIRPILPVS